MELGYKWMQQAWMPNPKSDVKLETAEDRLEFLERHLTGNQRNTWKRQISRKSKM
jgi:hypothetical protein